MTSDTSDTSDTPASTSTTADRTPLARFLVADVSTSHVEPSDLEGLRFVESVIAYVDEYGAWVWVPTDDLDDTFATMRDDGMSELFVDVLRRAGDAGCRYVRLDADAPVDGVLRTSDAW